MNNKIISFSTTRQWAGKPIAATNELGEPELDKNNRQVYRFDGKKVYIGYNWENYESNYPDVFSHITVLGMAIAPALVNESKGHKIDTHFLSHSILMVDMDSGMTIEELLQDDFYNDFGSGYYTTSSHTEAAHRFRIIFVLEADITCSEDMCLLYRWILNHYNNADTSCKNSTRLFYGSINAVRSEITDRYLPAEFVRRAIAVQIAKEGNEKTKLGTIKQNTAHAISTESSALTPEKKTRILKLLLAIPSMGHGFHNIFLAIGWGLQSEGYSLYDFTRVTNQLFPHKTAMCEDIWTNIPSKGSNIGAVINLIKEHYGEDWWKEDKQ